MWNCYSPELEYFQILSDLKFILTLGEVSKFEYFKITKGFEFEE